MIPLALGALLALTMFCAHQIGPAWPNVLRDRYLRIVAMLAAALTAWMEPGLGILFGCAVARWRSPAGLPSVLLLGTGSGIYAAVRYGGPDAHAAVQAMLIATAMVQAVWGAYELYWRGCYKLRLTLQQAREHPRGSMGNRLYIGMLGAMAAPLAPLWALPVCLLGVVTANAYTVMAAAWLGLLVAHPTWWPGLLTVAAAGAWPFYWWRGHPRDSWAQRWIVWRLSLATLWLQPWRLRVIGLGPGAFHALGRWWTARGWTGQHFRQGHNDLVQVTLEYGLLGAVAIALWLLNVGQHAMVGDPVTGAVVAMLVMAVAAFPSYLPHTAVPMLCMAAMLGAR